MNPYGDAIVTHWDVMPDGSNPIPRADEGLRTVCISLIEFMSTADTWADILLASHTLLHVNRIHKCLGMDKQAWGGAAAGSMK